MNGPKCKPLTPADCDLRHFKGMTFEVERLQRSKAWRICEDRPELAYYMLNLWMASWHEVPAASLPDDDDDLRAFARCKLERWPEVRADVMRGWLKCSDGRLYHGIVAEVALTSLGNSKKGKRGAAGKWGRTPDEVIRQNRSERLAAARAKATHTNVEWAALLTICGGVCLKCSATEKIVKDHIVPIYQGGSDGIENLQPLCQKCNASKGPNTDDLRPDNWLERLHDACPTPGRTSGRTSGIEGTELKEGRAPTEPLKQENKSLVFGIADGWSLDDVAIDDGLAVGLTKSEIEAAADQHLAYWGAKPDVRRTRDAWAQQWRSRMDDLAENPEQLARLKRKAASRPAKVTLREPPPTPAAGQAPDWWVSAAARLREAAPAHWTSYWSQVTPSDERGLVFAKSATLRECIAHSGVGAEAQRVLGFGIEARAA